MISQSAASGRAPRVYFTAAFVPRGEDGSARRCLPLGGKVARPVKAVTDEGGVYWKLFVKSRALVAANRFPDPSGRENRAAALRRARFIRPRRRCARTPPHQSAFRLTASPQGEAGNVFYSLCAASPPPQGEGGAGFCCRSPSNRPGWVSLPERRTIRESPLRCNHGGIGFS